MAVASLFPTTLGTVEPSDTSYLLTFDISGRSLCEVNLALIVYLGVNIDLDMLLLPDP